MGLFTGKLAQYFSVFCISIMKSVADDNDVDDDDDDDNDDSREECRRSDGPEITASMILIGMYFGGDGAWSPRVITCFGKTFFDVALTRDR